MSNSTPKGPATSSPRGRRVPVTFPLTTSARAAYEPAGAVYLRIGSASGGAAAYEIELTRVEAGLWSCYAEPDIAEGSYVYRVYDEGADRDLVEGAWTITPTLSAPA